MGDTSPSSLLEVNVGRLDLRRLRGSQDGRARRCEDAPAADERRVPFRVPSGPVVRSPTRLVVHGQFTMSLEGRSVANEPGGAVWAMTQAAANAASSFASVAAS